MTTKIKQREKLESMSDEELLKLQDGFMQLRSHATRGFENVTKILHDRLEKRFNYE
tara:strand:- start:746 stop:913 length:168 start_codon:yes stop_codon:yes gene_type:complete